MIPIVIGMTITATGVEILAPTLALFGIVAAQGIVDAINEPAYQNRRNTASSNSTSAKAPGQPTEKNGFKKPKNPDKQGLRTPPWGGKKGYEDKNGDWWLPTGPKTGGGGQPHGGAHWDLVPKKGEHKNIYPGGHIRY
ncbi:hypothetical protein TWF730_001370 [Orbilia blumenaviensis]|uniref:Toxin 37-like C-terminal domain-containing protein n=1 Tax=Orbilia blumenaviensis TaxID=1796055 RepID=A0AAV9UKJ3_9PEZI